MKIKTEISISLTKDGEWWTLFVPCYSAQDGKEIFTIQGGKFKEREEAVAKYWEIRNKYRKLEIA